MTKTQPKKKSDTSINEKYLSVLREIGDWTTVYDWAVKVGERHPDLLEKANHDAKGHRTATTGIREIAARISSWVSTGGWGSLVEVDSSERPRRVRLRSAEAAENYANQEAEEDLEPVTRGQKIRTDEERLGTKDRYRIAELEAIIGQLRSFFGLDFELDHAKALLNPTDPGSHHPDNLQLLLKTHNRTKGNENWPRFTADEQIEYLQVVIQLQRIVSKRMGVDLQEDVILAITERLNRVYNGQ